MGDGVLNVHCRSDNDDLGLVRLPVHSNYTHNFRTQMFRTTLYYCELTAPGFVQKTFDTFKDVIEFVDNECGGRHCFWKATDEGIFLYQIQKKQYFKKYDWDNAPPDDEDPKELDE
uniref:S-protein homolog n=1 Tax=Opuntia streptacantha TaxID=393608 RepID=A0A7C9D2U6_OPUST